MNKNTSSVHNYSLKRTGISKRIYLIHNTCITYTHKPLKHLTQYLQFSEFSALHTFKENFEKYSILKILPIKFSENVLNINIVISNIIFR